MDISIGQSSARLRATFPKRGIAPAKASLAASAPAEPSETFSMGQASWAMVSKQVALAPKPSVEEQAPTPQASPTSPRVIVSMEADPIISPLGPTKIQSPQSAREVAQTAVFMASMLGPRLGPKLLDSSNLLTIAGKRTQNFYSIAAPKMTELEKTRLETLNGYLKPKGLRLTHTGNEFVTDNLGAAERVSKENPWMKEFSTSEGWSGYDAWMESVWDTDKAEMAQGTLLGYPKQAIEDAKELYDPKKRDPKMEASVRVAYSRGIVLSVKPENLDNPDILRWQKEWGDFSKDVYSQPDIQSFLGEGEGKYSIPAERASQDTDRVLLPLLKTGMAKFSEASQQGKTLTEAFQPFRQEMESQGIKQDFFSAYKIIYQGHRGVETCQPYADIFDQNPAWKKELLSEAVTSSLQRIDFFVQKSKDDPDSRVNYPTLIKESEAKLEELKRQLANPEAKRALP